MLTGLAVGVQCQRVIVVRWLASDGVGTFTQFF
jgi:hypothetical protein